ncbi:MAG: hypothetical protein ACE14L_10145 [Terriglobales bacterium]
MKRLSSLQFVLAAVLTMPAVASAQVCYTAGDMPEATKESLQNAASQYLQDAQQGNSAVLQQNAEFNLGAFVEEQKDLFTGQPTVRAIYLLDNSQPAAKQGRVEFYCGIFNSPHRVAFVFPDLPAGQYGVVVQDLPASKTPATVTWILHQSGGWKIAGFYAKQKQIGGKDADWYLNQARAFKAKGQTYNAWFYYVIADDLTRPFPALATPQSDKLYDEMQAVKPGDLPVSGPTDLVVNGRTVKLTHISPIPVGDHLDLLVKYQTADVSDTGKAFQENMAVIKTLVTKYPQFREAFAGVVARAVAPSGQDYGTLMAMKDVK